MVGQLGSIEIAAVGLGNQVFFVMSLMVFGAVSGGSIFISQYWGKKDLEGIHRTTGIMFVIALVISTVFTLACLFTPEFLLRLYSKDQVVIKKGASYLRVVCPSYIFFGLSFVFASAERSTEHVRLPAVATITSVIVNGILNYIFIFGIKAGSVVLIKPYGIVGAAFATVISRIIECLIVFVGAYSRKFEVAVAPQKMFIRQPGFLPKYIKICLPVLINEALWGTGTSMQSSIFAHSGTDVIAAFNITCTVSNLLWPVCLGCGSAASILVGKTIGEGKHSEAISLAKKLCGFTSLLAVVLGVILVPLTKLLPLVFNVEAAVITMATVFLLMKAVSYPLDAFNMCSVIGAFRAGGDTVVALILDVGFMWLVALPLGWISVMVWHLPFWAIYICILSEPVCKAVMSFIRLMSGKWLHDVTEV